MGKPDAPWVNPRERIEATASALSSLARRALGAAEGFEQQVRGAEHADGWELLVRTPRGDIWLTEVSGAQTGWGLNDWLSVAYMCGVLVGWHNGGRQGEPRHWRRAAVTRDAPRDSRPLIERHGAALVSSMPATHAERFDDDQTPPRDPDTGRFVSHAHAERNDAQQTPPAIARPEVCPCPVCFDCCCVDPHCVNRADGTACRCKRRGAAHATKKKYVKA